MSNGKALKVNLDRLKENVIALSNIGKDQQGGIYRMVFTKEDYEARLWLIDKLKEIGIEAAFDGALNVIGKFNSHLNNPAIVIGSHIDTVPNAGALDGALGVLIGLECLQCLQESGVELDSPVELVAFSDEEGRLIYTASCAREDAIKVVKAWLYHQGEKENWMEYIK